jgi:hypothetical protein
MEPEPEPEPKKPQEGLVATSTRSTLAGAEAAATDIEAPLQMEQDENAVTASDREPQPLRLSFMQRGIAVIKARPLNIMCADIWLSVPHICQSAPSRTNQPGIPPHLHLGN